MPDARPQIEPTKVSLEDLDRAPSSLAREAALPQAEQDKLLDRFSVVTAENAALKDEVSRLRSALHTKEKLDALIEPYASKAFWYMCLYSMAVGGLLLASGKDGSGFDLDNTVLAYLVGSTAVTVIGLVGMVLTGIFVGARKSG